MASGIGADYQMNYFEPRSELRPEQDRDTLALDLAGFRKEQLMVQLDRQSRIIKISGARQLEDNQRIGFHKEFPISPNCDAQKITARFDGSMLLISMPKLIVPAEKETTKLPPVVTREPQTSTDKPERAGQETSASDDQKRQNGEKTSANDDQKKQTDANNLSKKSPEKGKTEVEKQEQPHEKTSASDDQKKQASVSDKSRVEENAEKVSANDDLKKQIDAKNIPEKSPEKGEKEVSKAKNEQAHAKTSASNDQNEEKIAKNLPEKSREKEEVEVTAHKRDVDEKSAGGKHNGVDNDRSAKTSLSDKQRKIPSTGKGQNVSSFAAIGACDPAAMLEMARKKMNMVMAFVLVLLLALYVGNKFVWYSEKGEN